MIEICSPLWGDENGDGMADEGDLFGFGTPLSYFNEEKGEIDCATRTIPWITAMGERAITVSEDRMGLTNTLGTEKMYAALEKLVTFHNNTKGANKMAKDDHFVQGRIGMYTAKFDILFARSAEINFDLGVLPLPKYDTAQSRYMTMADYHCPFAVVPTTANRELTGFCATALAAYGRELITPAYYETALKTRYADTQRDADMIELTMEGLTYDMYTVYMDGSILQSLINDKSFNFASYWAKNEKSVQKKLDNVMKAFNDYIE
jgi:hypothetical protein